MCDEDLVDEILSVFKEEPHVVKCSRIGVKKSNGSGRPIKVTLQSPEDVTVVLRHAKELKSIVAPDFSFSFKKTVFVTGQN